MITTTAWGEGTSPIHPTATGRGLSAPEDYAEEAAFYRRVLEKSGADPLETVIELGSGGGNNASDLKRRFRLTLVDRSPGMLAVSRALNPEDGPDRRAFLP